MRLVIPKTAKQIEEAGARRVIESTVQSDRGDAIGRTGAGGKAAGPLQAFPCIGSAQVERSFSKRVVGKRSRHVDCSAVILERGDDVRELGSENVPLHIQP